MANIIRSASSMPLNEMMTINSEMLEQYYEDQEFGPPSFDSIPNLSGHYIIGDGYIIWSYSSPPPNEFIIDIEEFLVLPSFDLEEKLNINSTHKGKMKAERYNDPLPAWTYEDSSNLAFLGLTMCYGVMYFLYSIFHRKEEIYTGVMIALHIWSLLLVLLLIFPVFIGSFIRFTYGTVKIMRFVMSGLLLVSSSFVFILLLDLLLLALFQS